MDADRPDTLPGALDLHRHDVEMTLGHNLVTGKPPCPALSGGRSQLFHGKPTARPGRRSPEIRIRRRPGLGTRRPAARATGPVPGRARGQAPVRTPVRPPSRRERPPRVGPDPQPQPSPPPAAGRSGARPAGRSARLPAGPPAVGRDRGSNRGTSRSGGTRPEPASAESADCSSVSRSTPSAGAPSKTEMTQSEHAGPRAAQAAQSTCRAWPVIAPPLLIRSPIDDLLASVLLHRLLAGHCRRPAGPHPGMSRTVQQATDKTFLPPLCRLSAATAPGLTGPAGS